MKLNPFKAVSYNESAINSIIDNNRFIIAETKLDGIRGLIVIRQNEEPQFYTRTGNLIQCLEGALTLEDIQPLISKQQMLYADGGLVVDCELTIKGVDFYTGSGLLRSHKLTESNKQYHSGSPTDNLFKLNRELLNVHIFGVLPLNKMLVKDEVIEVPTFLLQSHSEIVAMQLLSLNTGINFTVPESINAVDMGQIYEFYQDRINKGYEGLILKDPYGYYKRGKKTGWFKMKPENEADGKVVGLVWGSKGSKYERMVVGFEVELETTGHVVSACNMSESLMKEVTNNVLANGDSFYNDYQVQIKYMEKTNSGTLRHPSFDKFRGLEDSPTIKA